MYNNPDDPPVRVQLHRHVKVVMLPGQEQPEDYIDFTFYDTPVEKDALIRLGA